MGVFASTVRVERPTFPVDPEIEQRYMWLQRQLFDLAYSINLLGNEGTTFTNGAEKAVKWKAEMEGLKARGDQPILQKYPQLVQSLEKFWNPPRRAAAPPPPPAAAAAGGKVPAAASGGCATARGRVAPSTDPYMNAVFEAAQYVDASDPTLHLHCLQAGRAARHAGPEGRQRRGARRDRAPRIPGGAREKAIRTFKQRLRPSRTGRAHLHRYARPRRARDREPRVGLALREAGWSRPPSDFGTQGDKPTHPELLDDLAARFIEHGWSLKWLNKEIMLSATYRQSSQPRADGAEGRRGQRAAVAAEPAAARYRGVSRHARCVRPACSTNRWAACRAIWTATTFYRRSIYGRVSRARTPQMLGLFDFPEATQSAPGRDVTTSTLQQIFLMNSEFIQNLAAAAAKTAAAATGEAEQVGLLYRRILARDPTAAEMKSALGVSAEGHAAALRAGPAVDQRGDFSAMKHEADPPGNARNAGRRPRPRRPGRRVCGLVAERGSRRGPWQLCRARRCRPRRSTSSCST